MNTYLACLHLDIKIDKFTGHWWEIKEETPLHFWVTNLSLTARNCSLMIPSSTINIRLCPFNRFFPPLFFSSLEAAVQDQAQCTIATSWDVANAFNSNYLCWLLGKRRAKGGPFQVDSQHLDLITPAKRDWHLGQVETKVESASTEPPDIVSICQA